MAAGGRSNYYRTVMQDAPWLYWRFGAYQPANSESIPDMSGNSRNGVYYNPSVLVLGGDSIPLETALNDTPADYSYQQTDTNSGCIPYGGPWGGDIPIRVGVQRTYEIWCRRSSTQGLTSLQMPFSQFSNPHSGQTGAYTYWGGQFGISMRTVAFAPRGNDAAAVSWVDAIPLGPNNNGTAINVHQVIKFDDVAHTAELFINGISQGVKTGLATAQVYNAAIVVRIAEWAASSLYGLYPWRGLLDEFAVYNSLLSSDRILAHYLAGVQDPLKRGMFF